MHCPRSHLALVAPPDDCEGALTLILWVLRRHALSCRLYGNLCLIRNVDLARAPHARQPHTSSPVENPKADSKCCGRTPAGKNWPENAGPAEQGAGHLLCTPPLANGVVDGVHKDIYNLTHHPALWIGVIAEHTVAPAIHWGSLRNLRWRWLNTFKTIAGRELKNSTGKTTDQRQCR